MKKKIIFLVTIISIFTVSVYGQNGKKSFKAGSEFMKSMKYEDAVIQFTGAIAVEPSNGNYYYARGKAYEALMNYKDAKADYEKALVFTPKNVDSHIRLGAVCNKTEDFEVALKHLNRATGIDKRNTTVYPEKVKTLIGLEKYDQALKTSDTAIIVKDSPMNYYYRGLIYTKLNNDILAKKEFEKSISKNRKLPEPRLALAEILLKNNDSEGALDQCNEVLKNNDRNTSAYLMRSKVHRKNIDYPSAINDLSKNILIAPDNPQFYLDRGQCYQEFNQHTNAINDFTKYITLNPDNPVAFFARAKSYEEIMSYDKAMEDYSTITVLSEFNQEARKMLKGAQDRLYELNRETTAPDIVLISHTPVNESIEIKGDKNTILISGKIKEKSNIKYLTINNEQITTTRKNGEYDFLSNINVSDLDKITFVACDDYDNKKSLTYSLIRTEINPPRIIVLAPYASDDGQIYLENNSQNIVFQGKINDESKIKSIFVEGINAAFPSNELNPTFSTTPIDVLNKNKITIKAEDIYGNSQSSEFRLNRDAVAIAATNPMGKTWVVFIENSNYSTFASLDGPIKDINMMISAFANYQIHNIIHKQNMTKAEMEKFFSIELRDLIKTNQVKSLLIWYAGHGKFINEIGYWIPVDARRDDEFTYFNINTLRASMEPYLSYLTHTLVVTDACESGPGFYQAMRAIDKTRSCDDWNATQFKSSQVYSSAGYELAVDNSQFTRTFARALTNNPNACIPIEDVVKKVDIAVSGNNQQRPKFGKITGLKDEDGTFFFIAR